MLADRGGSATALAKRLEALTKELPADILIGEETYALVREHVVARDFGPQPIRGMEEEVPVYGIIGLTAASEAKGA